MASRTASMSAMVGGPSGRARASRTSRTLPQGRAIPWPPTACLPAPGDVSEVAGVLDALRGYVQLATGLTEVTMAKAREAAAALLAQGLRWWAVTTLGDRWSTRVIVVPRERPVTGGPYRFLRHPNYLAVILEMACLPLAWGMWRLAILFTVGNAVILWFRIREEERALGPDWSQAFEGTGRFVP